MLKNIKRVLNKSCHCYLANFIWLL